MNWKSLPPFLVATANGKATLTLIITVIITQTMHDLYANVDTNIHTDTTPIAILVRSVFQCLSKVITRLLRFWF